MDELNVIIGAKVVSVDNMSITFDNGVIVDVHPYETYVFNPKEAE